MIERENAAWLAQAIDATLGARVYDSARKLDGMMPWPLERGLPAQLRSLAEYFRENDRRTLGNGRLPSIDVHDWGTGDLTEYDAWHMLRDRDWMLDDLAPQGEPVLGADIGSELDDEPCLFHAAGNDGPCSRCER